MGRTNGRVGRVLLVLLLGLLILPWGGQRAGADEDGPVLDTRFFRIGALTMGKTVFGGEVTPPTAHDRNDSESPLFGFEGEEPVYPLGQADEIIELIKGAVEPVTWESVRGAELATMDEHLLFARAPKKTLDAVAAYLAERERDALRTLRFEVQAVPLEPGQAPPREPDAIAALLSGADTGPHLALVGLEGQRVSATNGRQLAYLYDFDTNVAEKSTISDPFVNVANLGLLVDFRAEPRGGAKGWLAHAWIRMAGLESLRSVPADEGRRIEVPTFATAELHALVGLDAGRWTLAGANGGWAFYVRAQALSYASRLGAPLAVPAFGQPRGSMQLRMYGVHDLATAPLWSVPDAPHHLMPSAYTPPEPPELREPSPFVSQSSLVDLLRRASGYERWQDPATMEVRNRTMIIRADEGTHGGVAAALAALRRHLVWSFETRVELLNVPAEFAAKLTATPWIEGPLAAALRTARRKGEVETVGQATMSHRRMTRTTSQEGSTRTYLQDYESNLAQDAAIGNPVVQSVFSGLSVDLLGTLTSSGDAAALEVRFTQTHLHDPIRTMQTPLGSIELPEMEVLRARTTLIAPLDKTVALAVAGDGERRRLILLTPRLVADR
ncbi:MAG: hypothetical protein QNJ90_15880 [Planctomycetota bacterium]|nr:hypothetical protein [Planctomycetota bacterium]